MSASIQMVSYAFSRLMVVMLVNLLWQFVSPLPIIYIRFNISLNEFELIVPNRVFFIYPLQYYVECLPIVYKRKIGQ